MQAMMMPQQEQMIQMQMMMQQMAQMEQAMQNGGSAPAQVSRAIDRRLLL